MGCRGSRPVEPRGLTILGQLVDQQRRVTDGYRGCEKAEDGSPFRYKVLPGEFIKITPPDQENEVQSLDLGSGRTERIVHFRLPNGIKVSRDFPSGAGRRVEISLADERNFSLDRSGEVGLGLKAELTELGLDAGLVAKVDHSSSAGTQQLRDTSTTAYAGKI